MTEDSRSGDEARGEEMSIADTRRLASALLRESVLGHPVPAPELIETHISIVVLTGPYAYKLRKPVQLPFLDFRTLAARREDCQRELELNRRWAPELYLDVVRITGTPDAPGLGNEGVTLDYAVRMMQFPHRARLDRVAASGQLDSGLTDTLADSVARLHQAAPRAGPDTPYGKNDAIRSQTLENLAVLGEHAGSAGMKRQLQALTRFSMQTLEALDEVFRKRRAQGQVRECHGDLHLANLIHLDGRVIPFDGVEFEPDFRWVDVISDLAFLVMDMRVHDLAPLDLALLDRYLQHTGDYQGLEVLKHYVVYRALVRAKVAALRLAQLASQGDDASDDATATRESLRRCLDLASATAAAPAAPMLVITAGLSGSGKSFVARRLAPALGGVCIRSDVERARLYPGDRERYARAATDATYLRLEELATDVLSVGYSAIVDATFLESSRRERMIALARRLGAPVRILAVEAPLDVLRSRIAARLEAGSDASEADLGVLDGQLERRQPLSPEQRALCVNVDSTRDEDPTELAARLAAPTPIPPVYPSVNTGKLVPPAARTFTVSHSLELHAPDITAYRQGNMGVDYVHSFDSGQSGPHVGVNALMHGNEICGAIALDLFLREGLRPARGRLSLSFVNVEAYARFDPANPGASRFVDEDLNRVWEVQRLDGTEDSTELRRARALRPIFDQMDFVLDIHSMSTLSEPIVLCNGLVKERKLARAMGYPRNVACGSGHVVGRRLIEYAPFHDAGNHKTALLVECGQHWVRDTATVAVDTALYFLNALDMLPDGFMSAHVSCADPPAQRMLEVTDGYTTKTDHFRFVEPFVGLEEFARAGTVVALDGDEQVCTPYDNCVLVMPHHVSEMNRRVLRFARYA